MFLKTLVFSLFIPFLFCSGALAWEVNLPETALDKSLILVDKGEKEFFYLEKNGEKTTRLHYPSIHGEIEGDKNVEGDLKTPEGVYFVRGKIQVPLDFEMYGNHAYALNYPNPIDRLRGKTGGGIWIHSKGKPIEGQFTQGCVAIDLENIKMLDEYLKPGTPVLIAQSIHSGFHKEKILERSNEKKSIQKSVEKADMAPLASEKGVSPLNSDNNIVITAEEATVVEAAKKIEEEAILAEEKSLFAEVFLPSDENGNKEEQPVTNANDVSSTLAHGTQPLQGQTGQHEDSSQYSVPMYVSEPQKISEDEMYVRQATLDWNRAWQERSEDFFAFYNVEDYSNTSGDFETFKIQKEGLFHTLSWIYIAIDDVKVLQGPNYFVSWFKQYYLAPNHKTEGIRRLYWIKGDDGRYRVSAMEWFPKSVGLEYMLDNKIKKEVPALLEKWRLAWEQANIEEYISYYSKYALQDSRKGIETIKDQKNSIWQYKKPRKVLFSDMKMHMEQDGLKVQMVQDYEDSSGYHDKGIKTLILHPKNGGWEIFKEAWKRM